MQYCSSGNTIAMGELFYQTTDLNVPFKVLTATISVSALLFCFRRALYTKPNSPESAYQGQSSPVMFRCKATFSSGLFISYFFPRSCGDLLGNISSLTFSYYVQNLEHATRNDHAAWQHLSQSDGL